MAPVSAASAVIGGNRWAYRNQIVGSGHELVKIADVRWLARETVDRGVPRTKRATVRFSEVLD